MPKILASAQFTIVDVLDGEKGDKGEQGIPGEDANIIDSTFEKGTKFWSSNNKTFQQLGTNVKVIASSQAIYGKNILEISNTQWVYSKNEISIEKDKIYKLTFRVRQTTDKTTGGSNIYTGAAVFNELGETVGTDGAGNMYFVVSAKAITVANGWLTFTGYVSTKARNALVNTNGEELFPAVKAFPNAAKTFKPMFIVNYNGGNGVTEVDGLILEDVTEQWDYISKLSNKIDKESEEVFNVLTDNGRIQGIYMEDDQLYINGQYINAKKLSVTNNLGTKTLEVTSNGDVNINANSLSISSSQVATNNDVNTAINNIQIGSTNLQPDSAFNKNNTYWSMGTGWSVDQGFTYEDVNTAHFSRTGLTSNNISYLYSRGIIKCAPGETYTASVYIYTTNKSTLDANHVFGIWFYDSENSVLSSIKKNVNSEIINNKWVRVNITATAPNDSYYIALVNGVEKNGNVWIAKPKLEKGNKATDWSLAPSDLTNDIIDVGAKVEEALSTAESKLNANQLDVFNALTENGTKKAISINNGDLFINATYINTGLLDAQYLNTRTLNVSNDDGLSTFNVDSKGDVTIHGTIASTEFSDDYETGYKLTPDGNAIFKNAKINGEFITLEGGISNYGTKNSNANLIKISQLKYKDATGTYSNEKLTWTITTTSGTGTTWGAGLYISGNTTRIPHSKTYTCSFEIKVPVACTWNVDVNTYAASGTSWAGNDNDNIGLRKTSSKSLSANVWTKCWFSFTNSHASNTSKVDLYDNSGFGIINNSGSNIVYEIRNIKGELSDTPTAWCPHNEEEISLVRFWAGSDYESRGSAPFRVMSDGSIYASKGNFSGVFSGKVSIGNITIEDTTSSKGSIEIKNNDNSKSLIKLNEDSSYFKSDFSIGDDFVFFDVNSKTLTNKGYIDLQNSSYSTRLNEGANIIKSADATGTHYQRYSSGTYVFDSRGTNTYGDFMFKRNDNANIDIRIEGDMYIKNKITMNNNIYILAKQDSGNSGYDFIIG